MKNVNVIVFCLLALTCLVTFGETLADLEHRRAALKAELAEVEEQILELMTEEMDTAPPSAEKTETLDLNAFLVGLNQRAAKVRSFKTEAQKKKIVTMLNELMAETAEGKSIRQVFKVKNVSMRPNGKAMV